MIFSNPNMQIDAEPLTTLDDELLEAYEDDEDFDAFNKRKLKYDFAIDRPIRHRPRQEPYKVGITRPSLSQIRKAKLEKKPIILKDLKAPKGSLQNPVTNKDLKAHKVINNAKQNELKTQEMKAKVTQEQAKADQEEAKANKLKKDNEGSKSEGIWTGVGYSLGGIVVGYLIALGVSKWKKRNT